MNHRPDRVHPGVPAPSFWQRPAGKALITAALIAAFFLAREHWGHLLGLWPYLLLLACPLMHLLHGHGDHHHGGPPPPRDDTNQEG